MSRRYYEIAKKNWKAGFWNREMLDNLLRLGRLTQEEYDDIIGGEDEESDRN